jgi:hypothetical protein
VRIEARSAIVAAAVVMAFGCVGASGLYRKLPYDPQRDFVAITEVLASGMVLVANPRVAAGSPQTLPPAAA